MTPDGWEDLSLSDLATIVGGGTPSRNQPTYWDGEVPWATPTDVTGLRGRIISETVSTITHGGLASSSAALLPPSSLLMTTRATIGACAINRVPMATNQGFQSLVPKQNTCVNFLYYLIRHHRRRIERLAAGSTFLEVSKRTVRTFRVAVPPLPEQHKIAAILSSVDDAIEKTQAVIDQVQVVKRGLMQELFTRGLPGRHTRFKRTEIGRIPEEWDAIPLERYCARVTDGTHDTPRRVTEGVPLLTAKNIRNGELDFKGSYLISEDDFIEISKRSRVDPGDVIFGMIGTIGNPVVVPSDVHELAIKNVALFKLDGDLTKADWLVAYLESPMFARRVLQQQTGNAQKFLPLGFLRKLLIPDASAEERGEIVATLRSVNLRLRTEAKCRSSLSQVKAALTSVLLTGERRVRPDPETP